MAIWTKEAVQLLIDSYKNKPCLYQTKNPNYHNKTLRQEILKRICAIIRTMRPNTTEKECSIKFHNLQNQFNTENARVRTSIKSIGSENVYKPNLWYYNSLKFLEEHIIPRKSKTSHLPNSNQHLSVHISQHDYSQVSEELQESIVNTNEVFENYNINAYNEEDLNNNNEESQCVSLSSNDTNTETQLIWEETNVQRAESPLPFTNLSNINTSSPPRPSSTSSSAQLSSDVCNLSSPSIACNSKKRKRKNEDVYVGAIEQSFAQSLKMSLSTPVNVMPENTDLVDTCMRFLSSLLKKMESADIKLGVKKMNTLVQTVINASVTDLERAKRH